MANQYEVLGKAPTPEDLKKLSPNNIHLTIAFQAHSLMPLQVLIIFVDQMKDPLL